MKVFNTFRHFVNPYYSGYIPSLFLQEREESPSYYIKNIDTLPFLDPVTSNHKSMAAKGGVLGLFQSLISQKRKLTCNFELQKPIVGYTYNLLTL